MDEGEGGDKRGLRTAERFASLPVQGVRPGARRLRTDRGTLANDARDRYTLAAGVGVGG